MQVSSTGQLGLNNTGDTVTLNNGAVNVASYTYGSEGGDNQSLTRDPDVTGADPLVKHSTATGSGGALFSPGTMIDGSQFPGCPAEKKIHEVQGNGASSRWLGRPSSLPVLSLAIFRMVSMARTAISMASTFRKRMPMRMQTLSHRKESLCSMEVRPL